MSMIRPRLLLRRAPRYAGRGADDSEFILDLYFTFLNRAPDRPGLSYWTGQLAQGLSRESLLLEFAFSAEFGAVLQAMGESSGRADVMSVMDMYRGLLGRLPDDGGYLYWIARLRQAQCSGGLALVDEMEAMAISFLASREVAQRQRTDAHISYLDGLALYGPQDAARLPLPDQLHPDAATHLLIGRRFADSALRPLNIHP
jgi:hypothetical protein